MADRADVEQLTRDEWARYQLGATAASDLPGVAVRLLLVGPADADLAGLASISDQAPRPAAEAAFDRFGRARDLPFLIDPDRRMELARQTTSAMSDGRIQVRVGALMIGQLMRLRDDDGHQLDNDDLQLISSLSYLVDEYPSQRDEILRQVLETARHFAECSTDT